MRRLRDVWPFYGFYALCLALLVFLGTRDLSVPLEAGYGTPITSAPQPICTASKVVNVSSATTTEIVALAAGQRVYVCGFYLNQVGNTTAPTAKFVAGTGTACGTGASDLTGVLTGGASANLIINHTYGNGAGMLFATPSGEALCLTSTTTQPQRGVVTYTQF